MSCALTTGYTIDCRTAVGGVETVWVIANGDLASVIDASGVVTAITKAPGKRFYKIEVPRATASTSNAGAGSQENGTWFVTHQVVFPLNKRDAATRNLVTTLAKNRLTIVTKEMDGTFRMFGKEFGLFLDSTEAGSGTAAGDRNGYNLTFTSVEKADFLEVSASVAAALETPGS
jgi:hypothetical protein